ncbi:Fatty acyl-CoA reductase wat [Blattella germanica]|nr:Fatty acyl-CoA reductase wat [Blattella germanica]
MNWKIPFNKTAWMVFLIPSRIRFLYKLYALFLHLLPATMIDAVLFSMGKSTSKIHKFSDVLAYFSTRQWKFTNPNVQKLWQKLSPEDQSIFDFNNKDLQWDNYFNSSLMGIRTYLLKDDPKTLPNAIRRRIMYVF